MLPLRSKHWLAAVGALKQCVRCGAPGEQVAHYSGTYSSVFGKGRGVKASDAMTAKLCRQCHEHFDGYKAGNDDERSIEFLLCILRTIHLLIWRESVKVAPRRS